MKRIYLFFVIFAICISAIYAEDIDDRIIKFAEENGKMYVKPLLNSFSANLNSGLYNTAKTLGTLKFGVFFNSPMYFVPEDDKTFTLKIPNQGEFPEESEELYNAVYNNNENNFETATIFGNKGTTLVDNNENPTYSLKLPNGSDISMIPFFMPQVHVGLPGGNEIMLRYTPPIKINDDIGELSFFGFGLKHSIDQYIPLCPVNLAVQGAYHQMKVGDILEFSSYSFNTQISKTLLLWTLYGGIGIEQTTLTAKYNYKPDAEGYDDIGTYKIDFQMDADNDFRATVGLRYSFLLAKFYVDYSICKYSTLNIGMGLSF